MRLCGPSNTKWRPATWSMHLLIEAPAYTLKLRSTQIDTKRSGRKVSIAAWILDSAELELLFNRGMRTPKQEVFPADGPMDVGERAGYRQLRGSAETETAALRQRVKELEEMLAALTNPTDPPELLEIERIVLGLKNACGGDTNLDQIL